LLPRCEKNSVGSFAKWSELPAVHIHLKEPVTPTTPVTPATLSVTRVAAVARVVGSSRLITHISFYPLFDA